MTFEIRKYQSSPEVWDRFVEDSNEGTIFHRLDFLGYHGSRFRDCENHLGIYKGTTLHGVMPMAVFEEDGKKIARSPYGASYGGPVFPKPLRYSESKEIAYRLVEFLSDLGVQSCSITLPISCAFQTYSETFCLALMECGFKVVNRDISSAVNLSQNLPLEKIITARARNMTNKARGYGIEIVRQGNLNEFYGLLIKNYQKFGTKPTHSLDELALLAALFPSRVFVNLGYYDNQPVVGVCNFVINKRVNSSFYLAQDPEFAHLQALSLLIYETLNDSLTAGFQWYDFGLSSTRMQGQENIFMFKESFGAVGVFRETYGWER